MDIHFPSPDSIGSLTGSICVRSNSNVLQNWAPEEAASQEDCFVKENLEFLKNLSKNVAEKEKEDKSVLEDVYMDIDGIPSSTFGEHFPIPFYDEGVYVMGTFDNFQSPEDALGSIGSPNVSVFEKPCTEFDSLEENLSQFECPFSLSCQPLMTRKEIIDLLVKCAEALSQGRHGLVGLMLSRVEQFSSAFGDPLQRLSHYAGEALKRNSLINCLNEECPNLAYDLASQAFYKALPFQKFLHFTSNQAILEAVDFSSYVHIIDLDIRQGFQWPSFMQALSVREGGPPKLLKITAIGIDQKRIQQTGERLCEFAKLMRIPFSFNNLFVDIRDLDYQTGFGVKQNEAVIVNCSVVLHRLLSKPGRIHGFLGFLRKLNPVRVTLMEVESNQNVPSVLGRFLQCLQLLEAVFNSIDVALERDNPERELIERFYVAPNISNVLGNDGENRYACINSWRKFFQRSGFKESRFSHFNQYQARLLLPLYPDDSFSVHHETSWMTLAWKDTPIVSVSAWTC
eukprot:TRINITY_DN5732_c0_g1_i1.p1 TRINITY_DN5732_c0_g1~~TRINITY_DN5732_c0_g1_i1.p1  ORF type:complete len:512 (+),score=95.57 TRINITY_DN5732_c0_g1_i1:215-1750(+)